MSSFQFYREQFNFELPSHQIATRHSKFINSEAARIDLYVWCFELHYFAWHVCQLCDSPVFCLFVFCYQYFGELKIFKSIRSDCLNDLSGSVRSAETICGTGVTHVLKSRGPSKSSRFLFHLISFISFHTTRTMWREVSSSDAILEIYLIQGKVRFTYIASHWAYRLQRRSRHIQGRRSA